MSAPGHLTDDELEDIDGVPRFGGGTPQALAVCARRVEALDAALEAAFGFGLTISEGGDYRTAAEQDALYASGGTDTTTYNSMHCRGQAIDIYNQRSFRDVNEAVFVGICAQYGITFPVAGEPWHAVISTYAFAGGIPDQPTASHRPTGVPMFVLFPNNDDNKWYAQGIKGRVRKLTDDEFLQMSRLQDWMLGRVVDANDNKYGHRRNAAAIETQRRVLADINGDA